MNDSQNRYDKYGWDYERFNPLTGTKIDWYTKYAKKAGGPVLELACGTGRLTTILAESGFEVDGIDLSPLMLNIAESRKKQLPTDIQSCLRFINEDITGFNLERDYSLIILGDNSFQELKNREEQAACLRCVRDHLNHDGSLLLTTRHYQSTDPRKDVIESQWSSPIQFRQGESVMRRSVIRINREKSIIERSLYYKTITSDGTEKIDSYFSQAPLMSPEDYQSIFDEIGFKYELYFDYSEKADNRDRSILCYICRKASL